MDSILVENTSDVVTFYADDKPYEFLKKPRYKLTVEFELVPDDNDIIFQILKERNEKQE